MTTMLITVFTDEGFGHPAFFPFFIIGHAIWIVVIVLLIVLVARRRRSCTRGGGCDGPTRGAASPAPQLNTALGLICPPLSSLPTSVPAKHGLGFEPRRVGWPGKLAVRGGGITVASSILCAPSPAIGPALDLSHACREPGNTHCARSPRPAPEVSPDQGWQGSGRRRRSGQRAVDDHDADHRHQWHPAANCRIDRLRL